MPTLHSPAKAARSFATMMGPLRYSGRVLGSPTAGDENPVEVSARDSSGGPNGIRTRVSTPPRTFASESGTCGVLSQRLRRGTETQPTIGCGGDVMFDGNRLGSARIQCPGAVLRRSWSALRARGFALGGHNPQVFAGQFERNLDGRGILRDRDHSKGC